MSYLQPKRQPTNIYILVFSSLQQLPNNLYMLTNSILVHLLPCPLSLAAICILFILLIQSPYTISYKILRCKGCSCILVTINSPDIIIQFLFPNLKRIVSISSIKGS